MCCEGWSGYEVKGQCPDCGMDVDEDGDAVEGCNYSPTQCETCGDSPCDESC